MISDENAMASVEGTQLADLRFCLASNVSFYEQNHRGEVWVIIQNNISNKQFSTTPLVRDFIKQFETETSLIQAFSAFDKFSLMPIEQWLDLIGKLVQADILKSKDLAGDDERLEQFAQAKSQANKLRFSRPWMIRLPLGNPNKILNKISSKVEALWCKLSLVIWVLVVGVAVILGLANFGDIADFWSSRFLDPSNLLLVLLIYPLLKFIHELGHGLAAKRWGADVVETGVLLILFVPLPYIDVSQSSFFPEKKHRMTVAAAGMMFELFAASIALFIWLITGSILIKDLCLNIILIGAVSSVFFNANPLLKFDGYYLLVDFLEIPNLGTRAAQMYKSVIYRRFFGLSIESPAYSKGEARWLVAYGFLSQCYRLGLSFFIAVYLGAHYFFIGSALALWLVFTQILKPAFLFFSQLFIDAKADEHGRRVESRLAIYTAVLAILVFMVPWRLNATYPGLVLLQPKASIQVTSSGFIEEVLAMHQDHVKQGQSLIKIYNPNIDSEITVLQQQIKESETQENQYRAQEPAQAQYYQDQAQTLRQEWNDKVSERTSMTVRSPIEGVFNMLSAENLVGRYVEKGEIIANVVSADYVEAIVMLSEDQMTEVEDFKRAAVYMRSAPESHYSVTEVQFTPSASKVLPSPYLGSLYGGEIPVDSQDESGKKALKPMFQLRLNLLHGANLPPIGSRIELKIERNGRTLARIFYRALLERLEEEGVFN